MACFGVIFVCREIVGERQGFYGSHRVLEILPVGNAVTLGIDFSVAAHVRKTVWGIRIGPPVRRKTHVIVFIAAGRCDVLASYRKRRDHEGAIGLADKLCQCRFEKLVACAAFVVLRLLRPTPSRMKTCGLESAAKSEAEMIRSFRRTAQVIAEMIADEIHELAVRHSVSYWPAPSARFRMRWVSLS